MFKFCTKYLILSVFVLIFGPCVFASDDISKQATAFYSDNNYNKSMDLLLQINETERTAQDWLLIGNILEDKGEAENAKFMYHKATVVDPKYYKAYYNLGNYYFKHNKYNMAIKNYKKAVSIKNDNPYLYYNLSCAYIKTGDLKKAKTALDNALTYKNDIPEVHYNLAYIYKKLNKQKLAETYLNNYNKLTYQ